MDRSRKGYGFGRLSYDVIGACIDVQRQLGLHCMEIDYQRALEIALPARNIEFQREMEIPVTFADAVVTKRRVDFWVRRGEDELIVEIKAKHELLPDDVEQCLLYLNQGRYRLCLLINFGEKPIGVRRFVHSPVQ